MNRFDDSTTVEVPLGLPKLIGVVMTVPVFVFAGYVLWTNEMSFEISEDPMWPFLPPLYAAGMVMMRNLFWPGIMRGSTRRTLASASSDKERQRAIEKSYNGFSAGGLAMYEGAAFLALAWCNVNSDIMSFAIGVVLALLMLWDFPRHYHYDNWRRRLLEEE